MKQIISCITVCRNNLEELKKTVESAVKQTYGLHEIIIVDGASTDGTPEALPHIIKLCESKGIRCIAVSEPDTGIYNAMNKGVGLSSGEWLIFMNAGDLFADVDSIAGVFIGKNYDAADVIYCDYIIKINSMTGRRSCLPVEQIAERWVACHQAIFTRRELLLKRPYQEKYRLCADYEWYLNCWLNGGRFKHSDTVVCISDRGGVSSESMYKCYLETIQLRDDNGVGGPRWKAELRKPYEWLYGKAYSVFLRITSHIKKKRKI